MKNRIFLKAEVSPFLLESGKEPRWLRDFFVDELDIVGRAIAVRGFLPNGFSLARFPNGSRIEFYYIDTGRRDNYGNGKLLLSMNNCRLTKCWIPEFVTNIPDAYQQDLEIFATIEGDIEFYEDN